SLPDALPTSSPATGAAGTAASARRACSQPVAQVAGQEGDAELDVAREPHRLEAFAHLAGQRQALGLLAQAIPAGLVAGLVLRFRQPLLQAIADQEAGLVAVAREVEAGTGAGLGQRGEIDRGGDVLQPRV